MGMGQWRRCRRRRRWVCTSAEPQRDVPAPTVSSLLTSGDVAERCRLAAVHPSVVRRPVDETPVFTTVRRRDGTLRGPTAQRRDGTVVRPSVRPTVLDGYGDDPYAFSAQLYAGYLPTRISERKKGLISGARTSRVGALPVCRAPAVDSFSSTEQFAEEDLVFEVRALHVGAPPALTSTPCPVSSGARSNSPRSSVPDTQSIHYPGFQVCLVDAPTFTGSLIIHHSETPQSEKENASPGRGPCKSASVTPPAPHLCFVGPL
ncbi:hypothetical protein B0H14DRAFT_285490 [Mycena olivaceomarginata]|nr:hypothetical protein B0H14DRAFT_285490 [Mycena olivaceomarginata]